MPVGGAAGRLGGTARGLGGTAGGLGGTAGGGEFGATAAGIDLVVLPSDVVTVTLTQPSVAVFPSSST